MKVNSTENKNNTTENNMKENNMNNINKVVNNMNASDGDKMTIIDLVHGMRHDFLKSWMAEHAECSRPLTQAEFVDYRRQLDEFDLASGGTSSLGAEALAQLREILRRVSEATRKIGDRTVRIGNRIIKFVMEMVRRYPRTARALVIMAALMFLAEQIPLVRHVLVPIVCGLGMIIASLVFFREYLQNLEAVGQGL